MGRPRARKLKKRGYTKDVERRVIRTFEHMLGFSDSRSPEAQVKREMIRHTKDFTGDKSLPTFGLDPKIVRRVLRDRIGTY